MPAPHRSSRVRLAGLLVVAASAPAAAADAPIEARPGGVVRWSAAGTESCRMGGRSWSPHGETCYFPIDLLQEGELAISRVRAGAAEAATVAIGAYPYRVQHIRLDDSRRVDLSPSDLERANAERARIDALWELDTPRRFELPLLPPLARMQPQASFGSRRFFNGQPRSPHSGEDYRGSAGTPVYAVAAGVVALAEEHFFGGNTVFIDHGDGLVSMSMHLQSMDVATGDAVEAGQQIGKVGATGRASGPHLHFGLRWRGARVDPAVLLP